MLKFLTKFTQQNSVPLGVLAGVVLSLMIAARIDNRTVTLQPASLPVLPRLKWQPLPSSDNTLTRIAFGSCLDQNKPQPIWRSISAARPELFLMLGDNVYGSSKSADKTVLVNAYLGLAGHADFEVARQAMPMLATWDDHDYGGNDAGADFPNREFARKLFGEFWKGSGSTAADAEGIYYAKIFGPPGRRIQIIMLDTRSFRSKLLRQGDNGSGNGRYQPDASVEKTMLGAQQWAWLEQELTKPAKVRIIASSIQVLAEGHGWERWGNLPAERQRLFDLVERTKANGVIFVSGDRHRAAIYNQVDGGPYPLYEITSSSMNRPYGQSDESGPYQLDTMYTKENFGLLRIDWKANEITLAVHDLAGKPVRSLSVNLSRLTTSQ